MIRPTLREALGAIVPEPPPPHDWAHESRRRGRNRRLAAGGVLTAAALALAVVAQAALGQLAPVPATTPAPARPSPTPTAARHSPCPSLAVMDYQRVEELGSETPLPLGARRVWWCSAGNGAGSVGPREPLELRPDRVAEFINSLGSSPGACGIAVGAVTSAVIVEYDDGRRHTVPVHHGCGTGSSAQQLVGELVKLWNEQRGTQPVPPPAPLNPCAVLPGKEWEMPGYSSFFPEDIARNAVSGTLCGLSADATDYSGPAIARPLSAELLAAIRRAAPARGQSWPGPPGSQFLVLENEFGDPATFVVRADGQLKLDGGAFALPDALVEEWAKLRRGLLTGPLYQPAKACDETYPDVSDPATIAASTRGLACPADVFAVPRKGPALEPGFAAELGRRFAAESRARPYYAGGGHSIVLANADGKSARLWYRVDSGRMILFDHARTWEIPADVVAKLASYGLNAK